MAILGFSKTLALKKLTIKDMSPIPTMFPMEVQFNPTTYKHSFRNAYQRRQGINTSGSNLKFLMSAPEMLSMTLIMQKPLEEGGFFALLSAGPTVYERVKKFLQISYQIVGSEHAPRLLELSWGSLRFEGALESVDVKYTAFDNTGDPIRAELDVTFRGTLKDPTGAKIISSPDLTHAHSVKDWQTLPMVTEEIYGDPHLYLLVAEANGLDHFRALEPGQKLHFPPTEKDESNA